MSDAKVKQVATSAPKANGSKSAVGGTKKTKKPANHPKYTDMKKKPTKAQKERGGSSHQAAHKYITSNVDVLKDIEIVNTGLKLALKRAIQACVLERIKCTGASASFRLADEAAAGPKRRLRKARAPMPKKVAKPKAAKSTAKKTAEPKVEKKPKVAKKATPKKVAVKK